MTETLGERLKATRLSKGHTQADAAIDMQTSQPNVDRWERDDSDPTKPELRAALTRYLGVTPIELAALRLASDERRERRSSLR